MCLNRRLILHFAAMPICTVVLGFGFSLVFFIVAIDVVMVVNSVAAYLIAIAAIATLFCLLFSVSIGSIPDAFVVVVIIDVSAVGPRILFFPEFSSQLLPYSVFSSSIWRFLADTALQPA